MSLGKTHSAIARTRMAARRGIIVRPRAGHCFEDTNPTAVGKSLPYKQFQNRSNQPDARACHLLGSAAGR